MGKSGAGREAVSPPSGGQFTAGLGEAFSLDLNSGQGTSQAMPTSTQPAGSATMA